MSRKSRGRCKAKESELMHAQRQQQEEELRRQTESQEKSSQSYIEKLEDVGKTESEIMEISRKRAIAQALASGGTTTAIQGTVDAINAYYKALNDQAAIDKKIADDKVIKDATDAQTKAQKIMSRNLHHSDNRRGYGSRAPESHCISAPHGRDAGRNRRHYRCAQ